MGIFEYFDRTRIVNLAVREDRRIETQEEFEKCGFSVRSEKVDFFPACSPDESAGFPSPGVRGCYLSHKNILEEAIQDKLENILFLEDDICFSKRLPELNESIVSELQTLDWDIAYFGHTLPAEKDVPHWELLTKPTQQTHFYAINSGIFERFLRFLDDVMSRPPGHPDGGPMHYDAAIHTFRVQNPDVKAFYYTHNLGFQRPSKTDLHKTAFYDDLRLFKPITGFLRKVKGKIMFHRS